MEKKGFKLQQVLNYRKDIEKAKSLELADAQRELDRAVNRLHREQAHAVRLAQELVIKQENGIDASELQIYANFIIKKQQDIAQQRELVEILGQTVTEKRELLIHASKEKKVLETYKDRKMADQKKEISINERNQLDEIALQKKVR